MLVIYVQLNATYFLSLKIFEEDGSEMIFEHLIKRTQEKNCKFQDFVKCLLKNCRIEHLIYLKQLRPSQEEYAML